MRESLRRVLQAGRIRVVGSRLGFLSSEVVPNIFQGDLSTGTRYLRVWQSVGCKFGWRPRRPQSLHSGAYGRLGNQFFEIVFSLEAAKALSVREVVFTGFSIFPEGVSCFEDISIRFEAEASGHAKRMITLRQVFASLIPTQKIVGASFLSWWSVRRRNPLTPDPKVVKYVSSLTELSLAIKPSDPDVLTIHLRSGDVFSHPYPSDHGQPPFSFYSKVIDSHEWSKVVIVAEDRANPNMELIESNLSRNELSYRLEIGTIEDAFSAIGSASNLVMSAGSFNAAVLAISGRLPDRVFVFGTEALPLQLRGVVRIIDEKGTYVNSILNDNWAGTEEQLELMRNYPESSLTLIECE